jgi:type IV secretory pathway VirB2 component (pilin)
MASAGSIADASAFVGTILSDTFATGLATIALVGVGFAMMSGRLDVRRGAAVIVGCFMMIGAPAIARGILGLGSTAAVPPPAMEGASAPPALEAKEVQKAADPYAGASLIR